MTLDALQIFYGEANPARARIYAQVARPADGDRWRLAGQVTGPRNEFAGTLEATVPLRDLGPGATLLAEAVLPDPCFWSPQSPALYEAELKLIDDRNEVRETVIRQFGVRALGVRGRSFYLEGKRWVLRAVDRRCDPDATPSRLDIWHKAWASMLTVSPTNELCREASRQGVLICAWVEGTRRDVENELRRLSRWAAVSMAVIDCCEPLNETISTVAPNLFLGHYVQAEHPLALPWAKFVAAEVDDPKQFAQRFAAAAHPVVALHRPEGVAGLKTARAACDRLQANLAPFGDYAGYGILGFDESIPAGSHEDRK
jgi:hypothetical protein